MVCEYVCVRVCLPVCELHNSVSCEALNLDKKVSYRKQIARQRSWSTV